MQSIQGKDEGLAREGNRSEAEKQSPPGVACWSLREPGGVAGWKDGVGFDAAVLADEVGFSFVREFGKDGFAGIRVAEIGDFDLCEMDEVLRGEVAVAGEGFEVGGGGGRSAILRPAEFPAVELESIEGHFLSGVVEGGENGGGRIFGHSLGRRGAGV